MINLLLSERQNLTGDLQAFEADFKQLRTKIELLKKKIEAIDTLLGPEHPRASEARITAISRPSAAEHLSEREALEVPAEEAAELGDYTPVEDYWPHILKVMSQLGGKVKRGKIIDAVGVAMKGILTRADYLTLPKSGYIRWRNRIAWQVSNMRKGGYIKCDSPRGVWEITDEGRNWLDNWVPKTQ